MTSVIPLAGFSVRSCKVSALLSNLSQRFPPFSFSKWCATYPALSFFSFAGNHTTNPVERRWTAVWAWSGDWRCFKIHFNVDLLTLASQMRSFTKQGQLLAAAAAQTATFSTSAQRAARLCAPTRAWTCGAVRKIFP